MDTLLSAALCNAAFAAVLVPMVSIFARISRRPALVHSLSLLIFLKLLTPPLWPVSFLWPVASHTDPSSSSSIAHELEFPALLVEESSREEATAEEMERSAIPSYIPAAPAGSFLDLEPRRHDLGPMATPSTLSTPPEALAPSAVSTSCSLSLQFWLVAIWWSGSALWLGLAGYRLYRFQWLLKFTQPASATLQARTRRLAERLGLARCPKVLVVAAPISPLLWAFFAQPRLVVPTYLLERLTEEQWDTLLAHELAHLRRRDHWVRILEMAALALYWWHPMVWWARRELRQAEEQCCDAWVVWALPAAADIYATALVEAVTYLSNARSALPVAASGIGQMHLLKRRVTMIMRGTTPRALSAAGFLAVLGLAAVLLPLYPTWAQTDQPPETALDNASAGAAPPIPGTLAPATASVETASSDQPIPGTPAIIGEASDAEPRNPFQPGMKDGRGYLETAEDAKDELELLRVQLQQRRAELREVEARLRQAKTTAERFSRLLSKSAVDSSEVEKARTEVEVQEARYEGKQAQVKEVELRLKQAQRRLAKFTNSAQPETRTVAPENPAYPSKERPTGSAIPPPLGPYTGPAIAPKSTSPPATIRGQRPPGFAAPSAGQGAGFGSFSGGTGLGGGMNGTSFSGGLGGFSGGVSVGTAPPASASAYEHRLAEVEKKLQVLMDEMKSLRKKQRPDEPEAKR